MATRSKPYKTTNLNLATYLILQGFEYELVFDRETRHGASIGAWVFQENEDRGIGSTVAEYNCGDALVEPKAYSRVLVTTRKEVIEFADKANASSH